MNRRDTIIVAVLVNAGLLAVLFMMAVNPDDELIKESSKPTQSPQSAFVSNKLPQENDEIAFIDSPPTDELDKALQDFAMNEPPEPILIDEDFLQEDTKKKNPSPDPDLVEITVKRGDSLDKIARTNASTIEAIRKENQLKSDTLRIGQVLRVPVGSQNKKSVGDSPSKPVANSVPTQAPKVVAVADPEYYVIKSGDNPWKIAKQFKVKFDDLLRLNNLDEEKARGLKPGDRIRVQ